MKKYVLILVLGILIATLASAADVAVITRFKDGSQQNQCVSVADGSSAKDALDASDLTLEWQEYPGFGYMLMSVNGISNTDDESWFFWHENGNADGFEASSVGFSGYTVKETGTVIGLSYTGFDSFTWQPLISPRFTGFNDICPMIKVSDVIIEVNGKKERSADAEGGEIDAEPGSKIEVEIELTNLYSEEDDINLEDVYIEGIIEGIDDGSDIEDETDEKDIAAGRDKKFKLNFQLPANPEDDDYEMVFNIYAEDENGLEHDRELSYDITIDREKHEIVLDKAEINLEEVSCDENFVLDISLMNIGEEEEDVELTISNEELMLYKVDTFTIESSESLEKKYSFRIAEAEAGEHILYVRADYGRETVEEEVSVVLKDRCGNHIGMTMDEDNTEEIKEGQTGLLQDKDAEEDEQPAAETTSFPENNFAEKKESSDVMVYALFGFLGVGILMAVIILVMLLSR